MLRLESRYRPEAVTVQPAQLRALMSMSYLPDLPDRSLTTAPT